MQPLKPGDVVVLRSGSSRMTVVSVHGDLVRVCWSEVAQNTDGPLDDIVYDFLPIVSLRLAGAQDPAGFLSN